MVPRTPEALPGNSQESGRTATHGEAQPAPQPSGRSRPAAELGVVAVLVAWALAVILLLDRTPYGLDEATARVVLLLWSIADQVPSPVITLGVPDFRALFLAPFGVVFPGSLLAVKIGTLLVYLAASIALFRWRARQDDTEGPLLATGLLLIAPLALEQIDRIAVGPFVLLGLVLGIWADELYRSTRTRFGGWYFTQLILCLALPTMHPAGLALPLVLAFGWLRHAAPEPAAPGIIPGRERTHVLVGVALAALCGLLLGGGWPQQAWLGNPLTALGQVLFAREAALAAGNGPLLGAGAALGLALLATLWLARAALLADRLGQALGLALCLALASGDRCFALFGLVLLLHWGFPLLLRVRLGRSGGFAGQRGVAFAALVVLCTVFLLDGRARYAEVHGAAILSAQDRLIEQAAQRVQQDEDQAAAAAVQPGLVTAEDKARRSPRVASQWPGRTMVACRCSSLPLPPAIDDPARFAANLRGIRYVVFDPQDPRNRPLSQSFAILGGAQAETVVLQPGGVLLRLRTETPAPGPDGKPAPAEKPGP